MLKRLIIFSFTLFISIACSSTHLALNEEMFEDEPESFEQDYDELGSEGAFTLNANLGKSINFGNALEAPSEGLWGLTLEESYFSEVKQAGFDTIRLPISWTYYAQQNAPYRISQAIFDRVDWAVAQAEQNDLNIIIDFHHYDELHENPVAHEARFLAMWIQIASHYQNASDKVYFELLNEPHGVFSENPAIWNDLLKKAIAVIRQTNLTRPIIVGPVGYNGIDYLAALELPDDKNLIGTFHFYDPFEFTHQGAEWLEPRLPTGITWNGKKRLLAWNNWSWDTDTTWKANSRGSERLEVKFNKAWAGFYLQTETPIASYDTLYFTTNQARTLRISCGGEDKTIQTQNGWRAYEIDVRDCINPNELIIQNDTNEAQEPFFMSRLEFRKADKSYKLFSFQQTLIARQLSIAKQWSRDKRIPLFMGEFGAYDTADMNARVRWTAFVRDAAERRGFSWAYWEFGAGFGIYDPNANVWREELFTALIP